MRFYAQIKKAHIFGSRTKENYKNGSDIDIAIQGDSISYDIVLNISEQLNEEALMPHYFDILDYDSIQNKDLTRHIDNLGILFYERNTIHSSI